MNQQQAINRVRELTAQAKRDWLAVQGTPMPEMGVTTEHHRINEQIRAGLLTTILKAGGSAQAADTAVLSAILFAATMIDSGDMNAYGEIVGLGQR